MSSWDTSKNAAATGVAVITNMTKFIIYKDEFVNFPWGNESNLVSGCYTTEDEWNASVDFEGVNNTSAIVQAHSSTMGIAAAQCARVQLGQFGFGYLPSQGDWSEAILLKPEIDACMEFIGGKPLYDSSRNNYRKWSSTQYSYDMAWYTDWTDLYQDAAYKSAYNSTICTRPFAEIPEGTVLV